MDIVFSNRELADLFEDNAAAKLQADYNPERTYRFITVINMIRAATSLDDLRMRRSLKYESLDEGISTVRVDAGHCLVVEDGNYASTRKLLIRALISIKRRFNKNLSIQRRTIKI